MDERKDEVSISSPLFYQYSSHLGLLVRFYEEVVGKDTYPRVYLGILASLDLIGSTIPEEVFGFYCTCLYYAGKQRVVYDVDGSQTPIPPFDPNDPMCADCRELVDLALVQYAFMSSLEDKKHPLKDFLGPVFSFSGIGVEGVDDGYHQTKEEFKGYMDQVRAKVLSDEAAEMEYRNWLNTKIKELIRIFEGNRA